jgi:hypothetical protein
MSFASRSPQSRYQCNDNTIAWCTDGATECTHRGAHSTFQRQFKFIAIIAPSLSSSHSDWPKQHQTLIDEQRPVGSVENSAMILHESVSKKSRTKRFGSAPSVVLQRKGS